MNFSQLGDFALIAQANQYDTSIRIEPHGLAITVKTKATKADGTPLPEDRSWLKPMQIVSWQQFDQAAPNVDVLTIALQHLNGIIERTLRESGCVALPPSI